MTLTFTTFILFTIVVALVQFGFVALIVIVGILAIVFAAIIAAVIGLLTIGRGISSERKPEGWF